MTKKINRYWLVNLLSSIEAQILEINESINVMDYVNIDYSKIENMKILVDDFLRPEYLFYDESSREKIKLALKYALNYLNEDDLEKIFNYYGTSVIDTLDFKITYEKATIMIWRLLFENESYQLKEDFIDLNEKLLIRLDK
ncbi:hypothetical protein [Tenacibaculum maritimum]|uniref:hypothetical protein n=1 Tax=Tenacibaculum maritimum TaxID=107401 RepID=UPI0004667D4C|nr:hypothetical protein [Tenacibaculum maritimum]MCD9564157.1 hypothetical protein [Tenacibaculum maritimum]MCD9567096.1 hypothetical protein [Tenacibaculum maritimum]MCD9577709.1 hypothetical protein [Tenacibaculum maritimum]MCD9613490.1 hypothetical protein [Tenacibaculum maritimum]CAA0186430.1 hypothetical protein JIP1097_20082 [Tenacibaculum maritimum]